MKKILNRPEDVVEEMIEGLVAVHDDIVHRVGDSRVVARNYEGAGKVGLVSGGGSGHEPSHAGFVGKGMLSAAVCGDVFTSPTVDQVYEGIKAADKGAGVFLVIKNYTGDVMNFEMAKEMAEENDGIKVEYVITNDDIAVEDSTWTEGRRGVAGTVLVHKLCGALAENGASLAEIKEEAEKIIKEMATLGLALTPAIVPQAGKPGFELAEDEIEFGIGIHGEPGYRKEKLTTSAGMAKEFYDKIKAELKLTPEDEVVVFVNGMGGTPLMEQYVFANDVLALLKADNIPVAKKILGDKMTAIEMAGISLTIFRIKDKKWLDLLNQEVEVIGW
ncbi:MAG: dihydroxyacetone kinase subunit DhaK [Erysipelothrix sp.]|jgi:dihydroxyacetone kinase-like protein|nr:dihydroxyacetone kinase subunit DhaK [Erysipelothrix sp.]